jgi:hypothetical protein
MKPKRGLKICSDIFTLTLIAFPIVSIVISIIGYCMFLAGQREAALWLCEITFLTTVAVMPIAIWKLELFSKTKVKNENHQGLMDA